MNYSRTRVLAGCLVFLLALVSIATSLTPIASALSDEQRKLFNSGVYYYDVDTGDATSQRCVLPGGNNQEKVWNFFVGDKNYTPEQAAGIIGNMLVESGVLPMRLQNTAPETETPAQSARNSTLGWGLVQWTPAGKIINTSFEADIGYEEIGTVEYQVRFLWEQLEGVGLGGTEHNEKAAGDHLKQQATAGDAAESFMTRYERPRDQSREKIDNRRGLAEDALIRLGSSPGDAGCDSLPDGDAQELAQQLLDSDNVGIDQPFRSQVENVASGTGPCPSVNNGQFSLDTELLRVLVALSQNSTFTISSIHRGCTGSTVGQGNNSRHWKGKAADISGSRSINGATITDYASHSSVIQTFVNQARALLAKSCELGVPNQTYIDQALTSGASPCTNVFIDIGTGPHIHIGVP